VAGQIALHKITTKMTLSVTK